MTDPAPRRSRGRPGTPTAPPARGTGDAQRHAGGLCPDRSRAPTASPRTRRSTRSSGPTTTSRSRPGGRPHRGRPRRAAEGRGLPAVHGRFRYAKQSAPSTRSSVTVMIGWSSSEAQRADRRDEKRCFVTSVSSDASALRSSEPLGRRACSTHWAAACSMDADVDLARLLWSRNDSAVEQ